MTKNNPLQTENDALRARIAILEASLGQSAGVTSVSFGSLVENAPGGITLLGPDGRLKFVSASIQGILGYLPAEVLGVDPIGMTHPDDLPALLALLHDLKQSPGKSASIRYRLRHKNGSWCWVESTIRNLLHEPGVEALVFNFQDIMALKAAQESLEELNRTLEERVAERTREIQDLYDHAPCGYHSLDSAGRFVHVNETELTWLGYSREEMIGRMSIFDLLPPEGLQEFKECYSRLMESGEMADLDLEIRRKDGSLLPVVISATAQYDGQGNFVKSRSTVMDNSRRKQNERALRESEETYRALFENGNDAIFLLKPDGTLQSANPLGVKLLGYSFEEIIGQSGAFFWPADEALKHRERIAQIQAGEQLPIFEGRLRRKDGLLIDVEVHVSLLRDENGQLKLIQSLVRDISARKQAENALKFSEERWHSLLENAPAIIFEIDRSGLILTQNRPLLGASAGDLVGRNLMQLNPPESQPVLHQVMRVVFEEGQRFSYEFPVSYGPLAGRTFAVFVGPVVMGPQIQSAVAVMLDITELKKVQAELEDQRDFARQVMDTIGSGLVVGNAQGQAEYVNPAMANLIGVSQAELIGKRAENYIVPEDLAILQQNIGRGLSPVSNHYECRLRTSTGAIRNMLVTSTPRWRDGQIIGRIAIFTDVTRDKEIEARLRQNRDELSAANISLEKAARLKDEFLASMSHELRTPLTGILGLSEALQLKTYGELNEKQLRALVNIENSGRHLLDLINDILDLSKIEAGMLDLQYAPCSLADICQSSLQLIKGLASQKHQQVDFSIFPISIILRADARRLKQMLVNLLSNAVKFTPEGGSLGLEVEASAVDHRVRLTVWDRGIGIPSGEFKRLFKPFVQLDSSLARQHPGTGLGLSLVRRMAELHGGSLALESAVGEGSRFTIFLPWSPQDTQPLNPLERDTTSLRSVLTVDDSAVDAETISRYLRALNIENIVQTTGMGVVAAALRVRPDVILLDTRLPDKSGFEVLAELKTDERTRDIPVVISSVEENHAKALAAGAAGYLLKPYSQAEIRKELSRVIAGRERARLEEKNPLPEKAKVILLVEDNEVNLEIVTDFLERNQMRVVTARSGLEALSLATEIYPHMILMDIQLPGMDGLEVIRRLRMHSDERVAFVPIVAMTALAMPGDREICFEAGADDYLSKPLNLERLAASLQEILQKTRK